MASASRWWRTAARDGTPDQVSYVLGQGDVRFVVTAGLSPESEVTRHVLVHGDGVRNLAWSVADPVKALETAERRGARVVAEPSTFEGEAGTVTTAAIATYGEVGHIFVNRSDWHGAWGPGSARTGYLPNGAALMWVFARSTT